MGSILDDFISEQPIINIDYIDILEYELYLGTFEEEVF